MIPMLTGLSSLAPYAKIGRPSPVEEDRMPNLLIKNSGTREGYVAIAAPGSSPLRRLEFGRLGLCGAHRTPE